MARVNDLGGLRGFGPVTPDSKDAPQFKETWESRVFALSRALMAKGYYTPDEFRFARERMGPSEYLTASYYERLLAAMEALLVEKGVLQASELEEE
jgi:nitrile hydratase subunit beta